MHADASMFPGGVAALLLQSLHPLAMAGVAGHSGYRGDPWGRLQRTSHFLATTTFGTVEDAEAAIARVRGIHERVRGRDPAAAPTVPATPTSLRVHVAEAYTLSAPTSATCNRSPSAEADTYVEQSALVARRLGAVDVPTTVADLGAALTEYRPELEATPEARDAARFLLLDPPLPWAARPATAHRDRRRRRLPAGRAGRCACPWWGRRRCAGVGRRPARHRGGALGDGRGGRGASARGGRVLRPTPDPVTSSSIPARVRSMLRRVSAGMATLTTGLLVHLSWVRSHDSVTRVPPSTGSRT